MKPKPLIILVTSFNLFLCTCSVLTERVRGPCIALYQKYHMELLASEGSTATVLHSEAGQQGEAGIRFPDGNLLPMTCHTGTFVGGKRAVALSLELLNSAGISGLSAPLFLRGVSEILWKSSISGRKQVPERGAQSWYIFLLSGSEIYLWLCWSQCHHSHQMPPTTAARALFCSCWICV